MSVVGDEAVAVAAEPRGGSSAATEGPAPAPVANRTEMWRRFRRNRLAMLGLVVLALFFLSGALAELLTGYPPGQVNTHAADLRPLGEGHLLGTDTVGRDLHTDVVYGARVSLRIGFAAGFIAASIGTLVGAVSGFFGGGIDMVVMRFTDVMLALPYLLVALAIIAAVGPGEMTVILVLGLLGWMPVARILRATVLQARESEYIEAARALGYGRARIILRHVLPNTIQPVIVYTTLFIGAAVLAEAALSFLGVGVQRPTPAWGLMVAEGSRSVREHPHMLFVPGVALSLLVTSAVFVGDGLRDALDPRLK